MKRHSTPRDSELPPSFALLPYRRAGGLLIMNLVSDGKPTPKKGIRLFGMDTTTLSPRSGDRSHRSWSLQRIDSQFG